MGILDVSNIRVEFGGIVALSDLSFTIEQGSITGLIGPNGAGKTTLFNVISRIYDPTAGSVTFDGHDLLSFAPHQIAQVGVCRTFQNLALWPGMSVMDNVMTGAHTQARGGFASGLLSLGRKAEEKRLRGEAWEILCKLGLEQFAFQQCAGLPYGTMKRIELARALIGRPKLLMLDEPATGLVHSEVDELGSLIERLRREFDLSVLLVEHHMGLVMSVSDRVVVLNFGNKLAEGTPAEVQQNDEVIGAYLGADV